MTDHAHIPTVFVSGPYSHSDPAQVQLHVNRAIEAGIICQDAGLAPLVPHLCHYAHLRWPRDYEDWMRTDLAWVHRADYMIRIGGKSQGADMEEEEAQLAGCKHVWFTGPRWRSDLRAWAEEVAG